MKNESSLDRLNKKMNMTEERVSEHENRKEKWLSLKNREKMNPINSMNSMNRTPRTYESVAIDLTFV